MKKLNFFLTLEKIPTFPWPGGKLDDFGGLAVDKMYDETYQKTAIAKALTPTGAEKLVAHNYIDGEDFSFRKFAYIISLHTIFKIDF